MFHPVFLTRDGFCRAVLAVAGLLPVLSFAATAVAAAAGGAAQGGNSRPNIVFIVADDLGWRDLACTGHPVHRTPNLDRLRKQGMMFLNANASAPICSASRASLLTGQSPARLHYEFVPKNEAGSQPASFPLRTPEYPTELTLGTPTVGSVLREAGYETAFFGKWHLNRHHGHYLQWSPTHGPLAFGFETGSSEFGAHPYSYPSKKNKPPAVPAGTFPDDALTGLAVSFLKKPHAKPFFLWLAFYYVHEPFHSRAAWLVDEYGRKLPADASVQRRNYAAMVATMDNEVGRVLDALDAAGLSKNTIVIFTSDNGGHPLVSANGPLRGSKWNLYEGGLRVPLFVSWPGVVKPGTMCDVPVIGSDLFPTLAEAAGVTSAAGKARDGVSVVPLLRGAPKLERPEGALYWHFPYYHPEDKYETAKAVVGVEDYVARHQVRPHSALRCGEDKLLWFAESDSVELYDLAADPGEQHNLAASQPEKAARLKALLMGRLRGAGARMPEPRVR